ncbi:hypothetical protein Bbelb_407000 [Branchiostoma belcheri]|nr:hypothetical protein Bbelb_407000 [Branchiostoma belcheri]
MRSSRRRCGIGLTTFNAETDVTRPFHETLPRGTKTNVAMAASNATVRMRLAHARETVPDWLSGSSTSLQNGCYYGAGLIRSAALDDGKAHTIMTAIQAFLRSVELGIDRMAGLWFTERKLQYFNYRLSRARMVVEGALDTTAGQAVEERKAHHHLGKNYTDYASALQQCGLETLENRRVNLCRKFAVSMEKSERTADLLPPTRGQSTRRELRNSTKRTLPITRCPSKGRDVVCGSSWRALISALTYLEGKAREQPCSQLASFRATLNEAKAYGHHPLLDRMVLRALRPKEDEDIAKKFAAVAAHPLGPRFNPLGQARSVDFAKITGQVPLGTGRADRACARGGRTGKRTRQVKQVLD